MPTVSHAININAPANRVWAVLTYAAAYPEWNPFMIELAERGVEARRTRIRRLR
jgi:hypothetical protein